MATNYPSSPDNFTNPTSTDYQDAPSHSAQHANANDAIEAMQTGQFPVNVVAASGSTETLPATHPAHVVTMDVDCTFTFGAGVAGHAFILYLSGAFTPTFPASVVWAGGSAPTYASAGTLYHFMTLDGGTTWLGSGEAYS